MIGELDKPGWGCLVTAQRAVTASGGEELTLDYVLVALLEEDSSGVVSRAMHAAGGDPSQVRAAIGSVPSLPRAQLLAGTGIYPDAETRAIMDRAFAEATSREHLLVEPGHLMLAMVSDPACSAYSLLLDNGVQLDRLCDCLVELLPTNTDSEEDLREWSHRFPRLPSEEVADLAAQVAAWREACRLVGIVKRQDQGLLGPEEDPVAISPAERVHLEQVQEETRDALLRLLDHHAYLAWEAARQCARQGHDFAYSYDRARKMIFGACMSYTGWTNVAFEQYAEARLASEMGCDFDEGWTSNGT